MNKFEFKLPDGTAVRTGNIVPDSMPLSFEPFPDKHLRPLAEIVELINNPNRISARTKFGERVDEMNQGRLGSCFPAGTLVRMADGTLKPIEEVRLLDEVLSAEGNKRRVIRTMVKSHVGKICRLNLWGHRHLLATPEHPILTKSGYKNIENLTKEDYVLIPRYMPQTDELLETEQHFKARSSSQLRQVNRSRQQSLSVSKRTATIIKQTSVPPIIELDHDFGWLIGIFLAEGSASDAKVIFHLNTNEEFTLASRLQEILKTKFDVDTTIVKGRGGRPNNLECKFYGTLWSELFKSLCFTGSANKRLHPDLCKGTKEFLTGVLQGWMDGDGIGNNTEKSDQRNRIGGVTVSKQLAMQMYDIATFLGLRPTICRQEVAINPKHKIKSRQPRYTVVWPKERLDGDEWTHSWLQKSDQDEKYVYRKVCSVTTEPFSGHVFNLEVEGDNSYVAESIGVHNCNAYMVGWMMSTLIYNATGIWKRLSPEWCYMNINGGRDEGSLLDKGMIFATDFGMAAYNPKLYEKFLPSQIDMETTRHAKDSSIEHRFHECYQAPRTNVTHCWHALLSCIAGGGATGLAVHVGDSYMRSKQIAGFDRGPGNHAVAGTELVLLKKQPTSIADIGITSPQSWGSRFADKGFTTLTINHIAEPMKYHGLYCVRSVCMSQDSESNTKLTT